ncbi:IS630 family transposase [bacterium]|nr:IS630 family transposase [bacterium]
MPPKKSASFVAAMKDVLAVYQRPVDPQRPLVCLDEFAKQLLSETRVPRPPLPGKVAQYDSEYVREGSVTAFMLAIPHLGQREVFVSEGGRRTAIDFAKCLDHLSELLPEAQKILVVMDNLNTHSEASLYKAFTPEKARALCEQFEFHFTPTHGSWLNMAEIEIGLLARGCLNRRIESIDRMCQEMEAFLKSRNANPVPIKWQFTHQDARIKLHSIYPSI